jgi:hypothetical protein
MRDNGNMATASETVQHRYIDELSRLFYLFRLAELNRRYYSARLASLKWREKVFRIAISLLTASSFGMLAFATDFSHVKLTAGILAFLAFVASVILPGFGFERKMDETSARACAWHYAVQQLETALRFVKNALENGGEVAGWTQCAEEVYHQVASLPDVDIEDRVLIRRVENEVNESFPSDYVWTAF